MPQSHAYKKERKSIPLVCINQFVYVRAQIVKLYSPVLQLMPPIQFQEASLLNWLNQVLLLLPTATFCAPILLRCHFLG